MESFDNQFMGTEFEESDAWPSWDVVFVCDLSHADRDQDVATMVDAFESYEWHKIPNSERLIEAYRELCAFDSKWSEAAGTFSIAPEEPTLCAFEFPHSDESAVERDFIVCWFKDRDFVVSTYSQSR